MCDHNVLFIHRHGGHPIKLVDTRVLVRRRKRSKKSLKSVMFDSQVSLVNKSQGLDKKEKKNQEFSLVAAQCNIIVACAYSLKYLQHCTYITVPYCTWSVILRSLLSFLLIKGIKTTLFEVDC